MSDFDLVVIGSGPGGYVAAIRAAQLGLKTAIVEKREALGGTCLNIGCIPSKALLHGSEMFHKAGHEFADWGVKTGKISLDLKALMAKKSTAVSSLTQGIAYLMKKNKIEHVAGSGKIAKAGQVNVALNAGGKKTLKAKHILIATGSDVVSLPGIEIDEKQIVSSTGALELGKVPKHMVVIGGGVIGLELGSVWRRLGADVTVVEFMDRITPEMDGEVSKNFARMLKKQGLTFTLKSKVTGIKKTKAGLTVSVEPAAGGDTSSIKCDVVLVSVGRRPYTDGLGLEKAGVALDDRGRVTVDGSFETSVSGIYAIGDVIAGPMLAHKAEDEGVACIEGMVGLTGYVNHDVIPGVIYTMPEVAAVGKTEEQLKEAGVAYAVGKFPFTANSRAKTNDETEGFVKILADKETDRVLGVHMIGVDAGNMIQEAVTVMEFDGTAMDVALACHAHPTHTEAVKEAALAVHGRALHI